ncbi:histidine phosphatase family protein [Thalassorhabdus alkalitolerans]|uniref:Histidine phosphatase family protein n=1 Tax=Thalassorhabdus alkalitolerans TaxID=2282697 RepID=A0ABW0YRR5_9BACI
MDDTRYIWILRHGLTEYNEQRRYCGWSNPSLQSSWEPSSHLIKELNLPSSCLLFSSDLLRCQETASMVYPWKKPIIDQGWREIHFGTWEGKTYEDLKENPRYRQWLNDPSLVSPPGGETLSAFHFRIQEAWETAWNHGAENTVIFTHGGVIREWIKVAADQKSSLWHIPYGGGIKASFQEREGGRVCISLQVVPSTGNANG